MGWLLGHRLRRAVVTALAGAVAAYLAFQLEPGTARVIAGAAAVAAALLYALFWVLAPDPATIGSWRRRLGRWVVLVLLSVVALAEAVVGVAVILGRLMANEVEPLDADWLNLGLAILAAVVFALVYWWARTFQCIVIASPHRWKISLLVAAAALTGGLAWLDQREPRFELDRAHREQARQAGAGLYDLVLVIDPADPVSRDLILAARRDIAAGRAERLFSPPSLNVDYNVAYGLALPQRRDGADPLWRLVEPPTTDRFELADSLARIKLRDGPVAAASYGRLLADMLVDHRVRWRRGAQRGVGFVLRHLPTVGELDDYLARPHAAIPVTADPTRACDDFLAGRGADTPVAADEPSVPVAWGDALAAHCRRREAYRAWEAAGRRRRDEPPPPVAVHALTGEKRQDRDALWWTWVRALDGRFRRPFLARAIGTEHVDAEQLLSDARDVHVGVPVGELANLTQIFRPHLYFDDSEKFFPLDADWLLREGGANRVCDHREGEDECEDVNGPQSLNTALDEYLDLAGGSRLGRDVAGRAGGPARMYVHVTEREGTLYLDYWWFLPFNTSPWQSELNCLPGLTLAKLSCHDHEGDWEGVTVVLKLIHRQVLPDPYFLGNVTPEAVVYEAHGHPVRWRWEDVDLAADPDRAATHPVVYSAAGSHASYPAGCRTDCFQRLSGESLGDGTFDGGQEWPYNDRERCEADQVDPGGARLGPCLLALPSTRDGSLGVLWNAFPGAWGAASCTKIGKVCSMVDGPRSPAYQGRFLRPWSARTGNLVQLAKFRDRYGPPVKSDTPRWPPDPWPPPEGAPLPLEPELPSSP